MDAIATTADRPIVDRSADWLIYIPSARPLAPKAISFASPWGSTLASMPNPQNATLGLKH